MAILPPVTVGESRWDTVDKVTKILAAVGQFPQDDPVLGRAAEIARAHQAGLTVTCVIDRLTAFDSTSADLDRMQQLLHLMAYEDIKAAVARQDVGISALDIRVEAGSPAPRLVELINEIGSDLVVMRAHQRESIVEKVIGSTTDRVIRTANVPVLVTKRPPRRAYQRVVVATEASAESAAAVAYAAALFPSAALYLIHVVQVPLQFETAMMRAGAGQAGIAAHRHALTREAKAHMREMSEMLANRPVPSKTRVVVGAPAKLIVQATWSPKVDLIVVGPGSASVIQQALLGSVTRRLLQEAACDVLVWRPAAGE